MSISKKRDKKKWRIRDTANMLKLSLGAVSEDLQLARAITNDRLEKCTSRNQALKRLRELSDLYTKDKK